jgi:hypothetical protein
LHGEDRISIVSDSASDALDHLDLVLHSPGEVSGPGYVIWQGLFPYRPSLLLLRCMMAHADVDGQVCRDHLGSGANALAHHGIHKVRVAMYGDVPPQILSRLFPRTVGVVVVRLLSCPFRPGFSVGVLGLMELSPSSGVRSICGLPTSRVDVQPMDLLPHLVTIFGVTYISFL